MNVIISAGLLMLTLAAAAVLGALCPLISPLSADCDCVIVGQLATPLLSLHFVVTFVLRTKREDAITVKCRLMYSERLFGSLVFIVEERTRGGYYFNGW